jgi:hypothetical protein
MSCDSIKWMVRGKIKKTIWTQMSEMKKLLTIV